jgi:hypothetical protein
MIEQASANSVRKTITVEARQQRAFEVFIDGFDTWWPHETHHTGEQQPETVTVEPCAGGRCFERAPDGTETDWGTVIAYEPYDRVIIGWQLTADFKYDPHFVTEVEVRFIAEGDGSTRVELEHRDLERYAERQAEITAVFDSEGGWTGLLKRYAAAVG